MTCHQMLSPLLRRLCVSSETSSRKSVTVEEGPEQDIGKQEIGQNQETLQMTTVSCSAADPDNDDISDHHQQGRRSSRPKSTSNFRSSRSHQETLTKDEARKRMLSWRKTTKPRAAAALEPQTKKRMSMK